jgi:alkaline phosphatase D
MPSRYNLKFGAMEIQRMVGIGKTGSTSVRIWLRSPSTGEHTIEVWQSGSPKKKQTARFTIPDRGNDNTHSVQFPDDFQGLNPLRPLKRYQYRVLSKQDKTLIGRGRFDTAPAKPEDTPERFSIAVMSCHQPFDETSAKLSEPSMRMLRLTKAALAAHDVRFILLCGDQIYSDHPKRRSLLDQHYTTTKLPYSNTPYGKKHIVRWPAETVRKAYQQRYRQFFWMKEVMDFYARYPCYPILDDHEILDDWGSEAFHTVPSGNVDFAKLKTGALKAYIDYQASRVMAPIETIPGSFHYSFDYGNVGVFVMDLRTQRSVKPRRLYAPEQLKDLKRFLAKSKDKHIILIVTSVPVVHLPDWLTTVGASLLGSKVDFPDHWSYKPNTPARDGFLRLIYNHQRKHPDQRVVLVSGDVHVGCVFGIEWEGTGGLTLYQFTSSAISNRMKKQYEVQASVWAPQLFSLSSHLEIGKAFPRGDVRLLRARQGSRKNNPFGGMNLGIINVETRKAKSYVTLKLIGYTDDDHDANAEMFTSKRL